MFDTGGLAVFGSLILFFLEVSFLSAELDGISFINKPEPIIAPLNDEVNFQCLLNVSPQEYQWRHGSEFLTHNDSQNFLTVQINDESQVGDYQCIGRYSSGSALASTAARLSLAELKEFPPQKEEFYEATVGNTVTIYCPPPVSNPPAVIHFYKDGLNLPTYTSSTTGSLLLPNVTGNDTGTYSCAATNYITESSVNSTLKVHFKVIDDPKPMQPRFLHEPQSSYIVQSGLNITLECTAVGNPVPKVKWQKIGSFLPPNRTEVVTGGLTISKIVLEDTGEYLCEINNNVGSPVHKKISLQVQEPPVVLKGPTSDTQKPEEGGELNLKCEVRGTPEPTIKWLLNSKTVDLDKNVQILGNMINIKPVEKRHAGFYQCFATNPIGSVYGATMVNVYPKQVKESDASFNEEEFVNKPPSNSNHRKHNPHMKNTRGKRKKNKHKDVMVEASRPNVTRLSDTSVMVRWSVPNNTGVPIILFKVQYTFRNASSGPPSKGKNWVTSEEIDPHVRSFAIESLHPDYFYKFRIAALYKNNDNKLSQPSFWFKLSRNVSQDGPQPPTPVLLSAEAISPSSIHIKWQFFNSPQNPVEGFYVYYRLSSSAAEYTKATVEGEHVRSFVINHLSADKSYDIKIQSFTVGAASNFSSIISQKTRKRMPSNEVPTQTIEPSKESGSSHSQLYLYIGAAVGGFGIFVLTCFLCCCFRRRLSPASSQDGTESCSKIGDTALTIQQLEPVTMNGFGNHNGKILNGRPPQRNGFNVHAMTITNNPLAESEQSKNVMELTYLSSRNTNCTAEGSSNP